MTPINIKEMQRNLESSTNKVAKKDLLDAGYFNLALIYLNEGQEIPPHPEGYDVVFYVIDGEGTITVGVEQFEVTEGSLIYSPKNMNRGIKCVRKLSLLGIRENVEEKTGD